jgi:hypothetical protein
MYSVSEILLKVEICFFSERAAVEIRGPVAMADWQWCNILFREAKRLRQCNCNGVKNVASVSLPCPGGSAGAATESGSGSRL